MNDKPVILITNDDGVNAKGLRELTNCLKGLGELIVFAPDSPRSGMSGAITATVPIKYELLSREDDLTIYSCTGTPVDCVKLALYTGIKPELLVSGINHGGNMSICVHYSGTMGAAIEGCILGVPSLGVSLDDHGRDVDFTETCRLARPVVEHLLRTGLPDGSCLNMNVPNIPNVKGVKICRQADARFIEEYMPVEDENGNSAYMLTGYMSVKNSMPDDDMTALKEGYASIVPCKIDVTDYALTQQLLSLQLLLS